jgi:hypothetical protein
VRQLNAAIPVEVFLVNGLDAPQMLLEGPNDRLRHHRDPVLVPLPLANGNLAAFKVQVLDPQTQCFHQPQAASVEQHGDQPLVAAEVGHDARDFIDREDDGSPPGATGANDAFDPVVEPGR